MCVCDHCSGKADPVNRTQVRVHRIFDRAARDGMRRISGALTATFPATQAERDFEQLWDMAFLNSKTAKGKTT